MIFDSIKHLSVYRNTLPGIAAAEDFLTRMGDGILTLEAGKIQLGGGVVVNVNRYEPKAEGSWEAHRNYIDLQYVVRGNEDMYSALIEDAEDAGEYNAAKDLLFFGGASRAVKMTFTDGDFALFFPEDVHMPGVKNDQSSGEVLKLVFKIPTPEYAHIAHIRQLCVTVGLPEDASAAVIAAAEKISAETANALTAAYFRDEDVAQQTEALAKELDISTDLCNLTVYMIFAQQTYYNYLAKGIDPAIFNNGMQDFAVWNLACQRKTDAPGLIQIGWLTMTLKEKLYRLGRFQYEPTTFAHSEYICGEYSVRRGDPVITIHIPEGEPLTDEARLDSYRQAEAFFGQHVFVCDSWLLYPAHRNFLQPGSRIISFMDDFVLLRSGESRGDLGNLWRMYGFKCDHTDFASLPEVTGMQRAYKKHLIETDGMTGSGYGVLVIENGEIISK